MVSWLVVPLKSIPWKTERVSVNFTCLLIRRVGNMTKEKSPAVVKRLPVSSERNETFFAPVQPKVSRSNPRDIRQQQADPNSEQVVRIPAPLFNQKPFFKPAIAQMHRQCSAHKQQEIEHDGNEREVQPEAQQPNDVFEGNNLSNSGAPRPAETRTVVNTRLAYNLESGKRCMPHPLTQVVQQKTNAGDIIQRQQAPTAPSGPTQPHTASEFHSQGEQWQNTILAPVIYPFRERMYHRLLDLYGSGGDNESLSGENLYQAVRETLSTSSIPSWVQQTFLEYAGMRYRSAHGSSLPPWLLVDILDELRNPATVRPRGRRTSARNRSNSEILGEFQQQHAAGEIPNEAWLYIIRKTDLRLGTSDPGWESANYTNVGDPIWRQALQRWTRTGNTMWRGDLMRNNAINTTSIVCNELAEVAQRHRGIRLPGGIAANSNFFYDQANASQPTSETTQPAPYFKHGPSISLEDLRPGASVFFLSNEWKNTPAEAHERVRVYPGVQYPVPWPSSVSPRDRQRRAQAAAEGPALSETGSRPAITEGYVDEDGWTYHISTQITRTKLLGEDVQGPVQTQWMKWSHQATVIGQSRRGITLLETTSIGAGLNTRSLSSLRSQFVFIAWLPEREGGTTSVAIPARGIATPATPTTSAGAGASTE
jgi:hypothetical protein